MSKDYGIAVLRENEVEEAVKELFSYESFVSGMQRLLPQELISIILDEQTRVKSVYDFQYKIIYRLLTYIKKISLSGLSATGIEQLNPEEKYLFISNHRDIVLDSAFLNYILFERQIPTSQIAIGDNLMKHRISELLFLINKSFVVKRSGTPRELYYYSIQLSNYIKDLILNQKDSVWIAQREGRAKDGDDRTQIGLVKMLSLSKREDLIAHFKELKIVPVAISYEYDPCSLLKTQEFLAKQKDPEYKKSYQEDVQHMLKGLSGHKGHLHFHFSQMLDLQLDELSAMDNPKQIIEKVAGLIDDSIHQNYRLHPINYLAFDLLNQSSQYRQYYQNADPNALRGYFDQQVDRIAVEDRPAGREYLLKMYANPLINWEAKNQKYQSS